jgi:hypothetical protein
VDDFSFMSIATDESIWLETDFEQEVWEVVRDLNGDKAPGLDGFTMAFFFFPAVLVCSEGGYNCSF